MVFQKIQICGKFITGMAIRKTTAWIILILSTTLSMCSTLTLTLGVGVVEPNCASQSRGDLLGHKTGQSAHLSQVPHNTLAWLHPLCQGGVETSMSAMALNLDFKASTRMHCQARNGGISGTLQVAWSFPKEWWARLGGWRCNMDLSTEGTDKSKATLGHQFPMAKSKYCSWSTVLLQIHSWGHHQDHIMPS